MYPVWIDRRVLLIVLAQRHLLMVFVLQVFPWSFGHREKSMGNGTWANQASHTCAHCFTSYDVGQTNSKNIGGEMQSYHVLRGTRIFGDSLITTRNKYPNWIPSLKVWFSNYLNIIRKYILHFKLLFQIMSPSHHYCNMIFYFSHLILALLILLKEVVFQTFSIYSGFINEIISKEKLICKILILVFWQGFWCYWWYYLGIPLAFRVF